MSVHDFGHLSRGRRIHISGLSDFFLLSGSVLHFYLSVSHARHPGVLPISDQNALILSAFACTLRARISGKCSSGKSAGGESPPVSLLSTSLHLDVKPQVVQILQSPFPHPNSISSLEPRRFHVGISALQEVFCELICT